MFLIKKTGLITIAGLIFNPLASLFYAVYKSADNRQVSRVVISLVFSIIAYRFVPYLEMDIVRYYEQYNKLTSYSLFSIHEFYQSNVLIIYYIKLIEVMGLSKEFIPFFCVFFSYWYYIGALNIAVNDVLDRKKYFLLLLSLLLTVQFIASASGLRNGLATSLFVYGCVKLYFIKNNKTGWCYLIFSVLTHSYTAVGFLLVAISKLMYKRVNGKVILTIVFVFSIMGLNNQFVEMLIHLLFPPELASYIQIGYIDNKFLGINAEMGFVQFIVNKWILPIQYYVGLAFLLLKKQNMNTRLSKQFYLFVCLMGSLTFITSDFLIIHLRYVYLFNIIMVFFFYYHEKSKFFHYTFILGAVITSMWGIYFFRFPLLEMLDMLYLPYILNFYHSINLQELIKT